MTWLWLWLPLAFVLIVLVAGVASCAVRGLRAYRRLRSLGRGVLAELSGFEARFARMARARPAASAAAERLGRAVERLEESRGRLEMLFRAAGGIAPLALGLRLLRAR